MRKLIALLWGFGLIVAGCGNHAGSEDGWAQLRSEPLVEMRLGEGSGATAERLVDIIKPDGYQSGSATHMAWAQTPNGRIDAVSFQNADGERCISAVGETATAEHWGFTTCPIGESRSWPGSGGNESFEHTVHVVDSTARLVEFGLSHGIELAIRPAAGVAAAEWPRSWGALTHITIHNEDGTTARFNAATASP